MQELIYPGLDLYNLYQIILIYFFVSLRVSSLLLSMPFFSIGFIPLQVRIVISIGITSFILGEVKVPNILDLNLLNLVHMNSLFKS